MNNSIINVFIKAITAVTTLTSWSITWEAIDALKAVIGGATEGGDEASFNWHYNPKTGLLAGQCSYGSGMRITPTECKLWTCGGHGVDITIQEDGTIGFWPDGKKSFQSWGDAGGEDEFLPEDTMSFRRGRACLEAYHK